GRRPDLRPLEKIFVDQDRERLGVRDRRDATDREPRPLPDEFGVGSTDRLRDQHRDLALVDAIGAARDDQHRALALLSAEHQRFRDLIHAAPQRARGLGRGARRLLEDDHRVAATRGGERLLDAPDARAQRQIGHGASSRTARATASGSGRTWMLSASESQRTIPRRSRTTVVGRGTSWPLWPPSTWTRP